MDRWKVKDSQYFRQRLIYIRHYFPAINVDELDDELFAQFSEDALWLHEQMVIKQSANALGMLA
ncbi:hypothetical protein CQR41_15640 [Enterococcus faecium]|nr:hypothetical protein CQR41_15640 [Enterococcus faecium]